MDIKPAPRTVMAESRHVERTHVEGACPECGQHALARYPVLAFGGWFQVTKCQACLFSVDREPWTRLGWIALPEDSFL